MGSHCAFNKKKKVNIFSKNIQITTKNVLAKIRDRTKRNGEKQIQVIQFVRVSDF